jgi:endonuclease G
MSRFLLAVPLLAISSLASADAVQGASEPAIEPRATPVVGGTAVPPGTWPDTVAVLGAQGVCSGTLIAADVVLTAGHCAGINPTQVIANTTNYNTAAGIKVGVKSITAYPNWQNTFDVSVVVLSSPITGVTPRAVGTGCTFQGFTENTMVHLVGFGLTTMAGTGSNTVLHEAMAPVLDPDCSGGNGCESGASPAGEFVAGGDGADSCFGDSGGPVYLDTPRGTMVIAAVSRGLDGSATPCGGGGIYVRTDKIVSWIETTTGKTIAKDSCEGDGSAGAGGGTGPDGGGDPGEDRAGMGGGCSTSGGGGGLLAVVAMLGGLRRRRR